jgi:chromate transporter
MNGRPSVATIFLAFLRLGLTSFGGPIAHLGYFRTELVERRRWLGDQAFAELVGLCQLLPGPTSSQVGFAIGLQAQGAAGGAAAWLGFTLPSAVLMIGFASVAGTLDQAESQRWLHGLLVVAVAVVAQATWGMARTLAPDRARASLAILATVAVLSLPGPWTPPAVLIAAGLFGLAAGLRGTAPSPPTTPATGEDVALPSRWPGLACALALLMLLVLLPLAARLSGDPIIALIDRFFRAGALVFGGGHVVLPLLQGAFVPEGLVSADDFMAGYGWAQAMPGPLFSFAAFLGAVIRLPPGGWMGGALALLAIYLPSFLMVGAALPFWSRLRQSRSLASALTGVNAAVVGVLLAALYTPVWTTAIRGSSDFILAILGFAALTLWRAPPWSVVLGTALAARAIA